MDVLDGSLICLTFSYNDGAYDMSTNDYNLSGEGSGSLDFVKSETVSDGITKRISNNSEDTEIVISNSNSEINAYADLTVHAEGINLQVANDNDTYLQSLTVDSDGLDLVSGIDDFKEIIVDENSINIKSSNNNTDYENGMEVDSERVYIKHLNNTENVNTELVLDNDGISLMATDVDLAMTWFLNLSKEDFIITDNNSYTLQMQNDGLHFNYFDNGVESEFFNISHYNDKSSLRLGGAFIDVADSTGRPIIRPDGATYGLEVPDTSSWTSNRTIATSSYIPEYSFDWDDLENGDLGVNQDAILAGVMNTLPDTILLHISNFMGENDLSIDIYMRKSLSVLPIEYDPPEQQEIDGVSVNIVSEETIGYTCYGVDNTSGYFVINKMTDENDNDYYSFGFDIEEDDEDGEEISTSPASDTVSQYGTWTNSSSSVILNSGIFPDTMTISGVENTLEYTNVNNPLIDNSTYILRNAGEITFNDGNGSEVQRYQLYVGKGCLLGKFYEVRCYFDLDNATDNNYTATIEIDYPDVTYTPAQ